MIDLSPILQALFSSHLLLSLLISLAAIPLLKLPAQRLGLVDHPGGRKQHEAITTLVGGPAIIIAISTSAIIWGLPQGYEGMSIAVIGLFVVGLIDDQFDISAKLRLVLQTGLITTAFYMDNIWISDFSLYEGFNIQLGVFSYPITILAFLGIMNAINMLDGLDGLSSGVVLITLGFLISISVLTNSFDITHVSTILFGAVLGFWAYNYRFSWRSKASVFMGDSGTMMLGFILPYLAVKLSITAPAMAPKSLLLWLFAIPIWDIFAVVIKRLKDGKSPMIAGRDHIHHVLQDTGLTVRQSLHLIYLLCIATASFGIVVKYFGLAQLEIYGIFTLSMFFYLGRVGSLSKYTQAEVYDFIVHGERRSNDINSVEVVDIAERRNLK